LHAAPFSKADAAAAGATLAAYAIGLIPFVMIRSAVATFYARKGHRYACKGRADRRRRNVALKVALMGTLAQIGLRSRPPLAPGQSAAGARFCGAKRISRVRSRMVKSLAKFAIAGIVLAAALLATARLRRLFRANELHSATRPRCCC